MAHDSVFIHRLEVETIIGVHAWELHQPRTLIFDLELGADLSAAAASDHLRDAIDYKAVADAIAAFAAERQFKLLEALAEALARRLFERFPILSLRMTITKPGAVTRTDGVGVRIERRREDYAVCGR